MYEDPFWLDGFAPIDFCHLEGRREHDCDKSRLLCTENCTLALKLFTVLAHFPYRWSTMGVQSQHHTLEAIHVETDQVWHGGNLPYPANPEIPPYLPARRIIWRMVWVLLGCFLAREGKKQSARERWGGGGGGGLQRRRRGNWLCAMNISQDTSVLLTV